MSDDSTPMVYTLPQSDWRTRYGRYLHEGEWQCNRCKVFLGNRFFYVERDGQSEIWCDACYRTEQRAQARGRKPRVALKVRSFGDDEGTPSIRRQWQNGGDYES